jgi:hypothetical protein
MLCTRLSLDFHCRREALVNALWGDYSFSPKDKRVVKIKRSESSRAKPMFVQFVLEPIWKVGPLSGPAAVYVRVPIGNAVCYPLEGTGDAVCYTIKAIVTWPQFQPGSCAVLPRGCIRAASFCA